ncbi:GTP-binding protein ypt1 [Entamoeba marina]
MSNSSYKYLFKILLVGEPNVGKTSLLLRYVDDTFSKDTTLSIGVDYKFKSITLDGEIIKCQIYDTAGQEKFREIGNSYYHGAHAALFVFDGGDISTFQGLELWDKDVRKYNQEIKIFLVCNKSDNAIVVEENDIQSLAEQISENQQWKKTSAKTGEGVQEAFETLIRLLIPKKNQGIKEKKKKGKKACCVV